MRYFCHWVVDRVQHHDRDRVQHHDRDRVQHHDRDRLVPLPSVYKELKEMKQRNSMPVDMDLTSTLASAPPSQPDSSG